MKLDVLVVLVLGLIPARSLLIHEASLLTLGQSPPLNLAHWFPNWWAANHQEIRRYSVLKVSVPTPMAVTGSRRWNWDLAESG